MPRQALGVHTIPKLLLISKMSVLHKAMFLKLENSLPFAHIADRRSIVGIRHDDEQGRLAISQGVQLQLVIGGQVTQLLNIKGGQPCAAGNQDGFCCFARDELSRTF